LSIAAYYFFSSLRQFSNSISKKWLVFGGDPILEPIFDFCERSEPVTCYLLREQPIIRRSNVRRIRRCGITSHLSVSKYFFSDMRPSVVVKKKTLSCLCSFPAIFLNARLKRINCSRYRLSVMDGIDRQISAAHSKQDPFGPTRYRA